MISAGIDAGSRAIKVVIFDHARSQILGSAVSDQGLDQPQLAEALYEKTLASAGLDRAQVGSVVATGYGRHRVAFAKTTVSEITCHAGGVRHHAPEARSIIEIGGQDSKVILLDESGHVRDFAMNDRCAAGTGRFLEMLAERLHVGVTALGELGNSSNRPAVISSTCVVFAETEIIGLLADGAAPADVAAGVQKAMAQRIVALAGRGLAPPIFFTGGVALQPGMVCALEEVLDCPVRVAQAPQLTGALGAALMVPSGS